MYSGGTTSEVGILEAVSPGALPGYNSPGQVVVRPNAVLAVLATGAAGQWSSTDIDDLVANSTWDTGSFLGIHVASNSFTHGVITGKQGLVKLGVGTLTLNGVNTYSGRTELQNGTVVLGVANSLPSGTFLQLGDRSTNTSAAGLDLSGGGQTVARLYGVTQTNVNATATNRIVSVSAGEELRVISTGEKVVQIQMGAHVEIGSGGRLALTNATGTMMLMGWNTGDGVNYNGLDASGLDELHADIGTVVIGYDAPGVPENSRQAVWVLAGTNTIRANVIHVGEGIRNGTIRGRLLLGVTNRLNVATLNIGHEKGTGWLLFRNDVANPSVWIAGRNPGERANIYQGEFRQLNSGTQPYGYLMITNAGHI